MDPVDELPEDPSDWLDTDGDGIGNLADGDDDGDGVADAVDAFPLDGAESADADGDGVGDNGDLFPDDPDEWGDADDDGVGDNADPFPDDPDEWADADGDGVGDNADPFPDDPDEWADADGDGVGDNADLFPDDPDEWGDADGDGIGDNADPDADGDGVPNEFDLYPLDSEKAAIASYVFVAEERGWLASLHAGGGGDGRVVIGARAHDSWRGAVYVIAAADFTAIDAADGRADREIDLANTPSGASSWKLVGGRVAAVRDMDGDGLADLVVGGGRTLYFVSGADLDAADAADGVIDRIVSLGEAAPGPSSWTMVGGHINSFAVVDLNGDGRSELILGEPYACTEICAGAGAAHVVALDDIPAADAADGSADGIVRLDNVRAQPASYRLTGEIDGGQAGRAVGPVGDLDGDGLADFGVGAPYAEIDGHTNAGVAYLVSSGGLTAADAADGKADGTIELGRVAGEPGSWKVTGSRGWNRLGTRVDQAGAVGLLLAGDGDSYIVAREELAELDAADGTTDGTITAQSIADAPDSWVLPRSDVLWAEDADGDGDDDILLSRFHAYLFGAGMLAELDAVDGDADGRVRVHGGSDGTWVMRRMVTRRAVGFNSPRLGAGDVDGDGRADLLLTAEQSYNFDLPHRVYLVSGADLPAVDRADGESDREFRLHDLAGDTDGDGIANTLDADDDGDGIPDDSDRFPIDPAEWADADYDGYGDNIDAFPDDGREWRDIDGDGVGDRADEDADGDGVPDAEDEYPFDTDNDGLDNWDDPDDDGDGVRDGEDALPIDPEESRDSDADGVGDNADSDDDNDGVPDAEDAFPLDAAESRDSDGDGTGDNADAFPDDPDEQADTDGDGTGDHADGDDDNDGVPDAEDAFPLDAAESRDSDGDGTGDNADAFPDDPDERADTDGDDVGDNRDLFPDDPDEWGDADGDGVGDNGDLFPDDPDEWADADGDGIGDNADGDDDNDGVADAADLFPLDGERWALTSLKFVSGDDADALGTSLAAVGDLDGDGKPELLLGAPDHEPNGVVHVLSSRDLVSADDADGVRDGAVSVEHIARQPWSWTLAGEDGLSAGTALAEAGDLNGDGVPEFVVGAVASLLDAAYVISGPDLPGADAADGVADGVVALKAIGDGAASWRLGGDWGGRLGYRLADAVVGEDAQGYVLAGQPGVREGNSPGTAHLLSGGRLSVLDAADGRVDGRLDLHRHRYAGPGLFDGENSGDGAGDALAAADFDGDGVTDVLVGAPGHDAFRRDSGAAYLVNGRAIERSGPLGPFDLGLAAGAASSFKFVGEAGDRLGSGLAVGDVNGDGHPDLVLTSSSNHNLHVDVVSGTHANLVGMDALDGAEDGVIRVIGEELTGRWRLSCTSSWFCAGSPKLATVDSGGVGRTDLLVPLYASSSTDQPFVVLLPATAVVPGGSTGGMSTLEEAAEEGYAFHGEALEERSQHWWARPTVAGAGDMDGDGREELLLGIGLRSSQGTASAAYLIFASDLEPLDAADGLRDGRIDLANVVGRRP